LVADGCTNDFGPEKIVWSCVEAVPIEVVDGLPLIKGTVNEKGPYDFVLDTLSQVIFVDEDLIQTKEYTEAKISIGGKDLGLLTVKGRDMDPDEIFLGRDIAGLIGQAFFLERFTVIDFVNQRAFLFEDPPAMEVALPGHEGRIPLEGQYELQNMMPVVKPTIGKAGEVSLLLDTSTRDCVVYQRVFDAVDDGTLPQLRGYLFTTNYGKEEGFVTRIPELIMGEIKTKDLVAVVIPDDNHLKGILSPNGVEVEGFLGAPFWRRFAVGVDGELVPGENRKKLFLWGTGEDTILNDPWTKVGIELSLRNAAVTVEMVYKGTNAEQMGLEVGDVLEGETDLVAARQNLQGNAGETRKLTVQGKGEITVTIEDLLP
ncbi:MAG: hypothetical protein V1754_07450, partial [Pseudomonadota bacterium]